MISPGIKKIKLRIIVTIAAIITLVAALFLHEISEQRKRAIAVSENQTLGYARALGQHAERTFADTERVSRDVLHYIDQAGGIDRLTPRQLYDMMKRQSEGVPQIGDMFIVDANGRMINNTSHFPPNLIDVSDRDYFKFYAANPDAGVTLGMPVISRLVGRWRFNLMRPLAKPGEPFKGVLAIAFEVEYFNRFLDPGSIGKGGNITLLHTNGKPLVYEPIYENAYAADYSNSQLFKEILPQNQNSGTFHIKESIVDKTPRIASYQRLSRYPVIALVSLNKDDVLSDWRREIVVTGISGFFLCLIIAILGRLTFSYINRLHLSQDELQQQKNELESINRQEETKARILEQMALNAPLPELLTMIVRFVEEQSSSALCSILLADPDSGVLRHGAAPSLPDSYNKAVDGVQIADRTDSCGTAAFSKKRLVIEDIATHPYWKEFTPATDAGLRSCWSEPVITANGELLGIFVIYHKEPRTPAAEEIMLIESAANLANLAISRVRARDESKLLEEQLQHIQRIDAVGQMTGGISHDLNNLLTPILIYAEMIKKKLPSDHPEQKKIDGILLAAHKAKDLNQRLLTFSRKQLLCMEYIDLNRLIDSFTDILHRTLPENIQVTISPKEQSAPMYGDRVQIEQILLNLLLNARDAIDGNGAISIETGSIVIDAQMARRMPGIATGKQIMLTVSDSGHGMNDDVRRHIFEPFYTTKEAGKGAGLGLAMVYGLVKQHNGYISVESTPGKGSRFMLYFPAVETGPDVPEQVDGLQSAGPVVHENGQATILLAEDSEMIRTMTTELLETAGYRVLVAELPSVALAIARERDDIDLLISDVVMPEMDGQELHQQLQLLKPELPAIFISGYTNNIILHDGAPKEGYNFLYKPFTSQQLLDAVRSVIQNQ